MDYLKKCGIAIMCMWRRVTNHGYIREEKWHIGEPWVSE